MAGTRNSAGVNAGGLGSKFVNPLYKAAQSVTSYVGNVAREVRDIPTAIGTYGTLKFDPDSKYDRYSTQKIEKAKAVKNIKNQISEAITAATTGKKGTASGKAGFGDGEVPYTYFSGTKRK